MASADGLDAEVRNALAARFGLGRVGPPDRALDRSAVAGTDLFFRIFLAAFSNSRADRPARHLSRPLLSERDRALLWNGAICDGTDPAVVFDRVTLSDGAVLGGSGRVRARNRQCLATGNAAGLLALLSFVRTRGRCVCELPVGREDRR